MSEYKSNLPILLVGALNSIRSMARFQKLAFLADKEIFKDADKYSDWTSHYYGPFSRDLEADVDTYCEDGMLAVVDITHPVSHNPVPFYSITSNGRTKFKSFYADNHAKIKEIAAQLFHFQFHKTNAGLLHYVYKHHKEFTVNSVIKDEMGD